MLGLVAWRVTFGMSLADDGYYAAATLRLAQGARIFVDEMYVQSLGFLAAVPFAKVWLWLFGTTGIVVALRLFYVAVAAGAAATVYRTLRPSFAPWASLVAAVVPFLAPAYNLFWVSYDTMAALGMVLACLLAFAAVRDDRPWLAVAAGAAAAFASVSYPPLAVVAVVLLVTLAVRGRDRRLTVAALTGMVVVGAAFAVWLLSKTSIAELRFTYDLVAGRLSVTGPGQSHVTRIFGDLQELWRTLRMNWIVPLWAWYAPRRPYPWVLPSWPLAPPSALGLAAWCSRSCRWRSRSPSSPNGRRTASAADC